jgi:hypothetical protein
VLNRARASPATDLYEEKSEEYEVAAGRNNRAAGGEGRRHIAILLQFWADGGTQAFLSEERTKKKQVPRANTALGMTILVLAAWEWKKPQVQKANLSYTLYNFARLNGGTS